MCPYFLTVWCCAAVPEESSVRASAIKGLGEQAVREVEANTRQLAYSVQLLHKLKIAMIQIFAVWGVQDYKRLKQHTLSISKRNCFRDFKAGGVAARPPTGLEYH